MAFTVLTEAFHEATALLLQQKDSFAVKMYIEYSTDSGYTTPDESTVTATADHNAYYTALNGTSEDFIRVDVSQFSRVVGSGHYQGSNALPYSNNKITFTGFTSDGGSAGEHSLAIANGHVYGAAVVLSDTAVNTSASDIIIARAYFDTTYTQVTSNKGASIQIALNLVSDGSCTGFATGDVTFTDIPTSGNIVTIIDNAATPVTKVFEFNSTVTTADGSTIAAATGSGSTINICVGTSGITGTGTDAQLTSAVNGITGFAVTAVDSTSVAGKVELTQDYCGTGGNTTIVKMGINLTVTGFTGGA